MCRNMLCFFVVEMNRKLSRRKNVREVGAMREITVRHKCQKA